MGYKRNYKIHAGSKIMHPFCSANHHDRNVVGTENDRNVNLQQVLLYSISARHTLEIAVTMSTKHQATC